MNKNSREILKRIADRNNDGHWEIKPEGKYRTEVGRRMFSARVRRLWSVLSPEERSLNIKSKA